MTHVWGADVRPDTRGRLMKIISWRTASLGAAAVLYVALKAVAIPLLDDDPATVPNFREVIEALLSNGEIILVSLGLWVARDNVVSSQQVGIRDELPPPPPLVADAIQRSQRR